MLGCGGGGGVAPALPRIWLTCSFSASFANRSLRFGLANGSPSGWMTFMPAIVAGFSWAGWTADAVVGGSGVTATGVGPLAGGAGCGAGVASVATGGSGDDASGE